MIDSVLATEAQWGDRPLDAALHLSQTEVPLDYTGIGEIDTKVRRAGISWRERYGKRLQLGLIGGASYLTQSNNTATAGIEPNGYHAGLSLDIDVYSNARFRVDAAATYLYQHVDYGADTNKIVIAWHESSAQLTASALIGGGLWTQLGARYGAIDGEQRLSGTQNETRDIERSARLGAIVGLQLEVEREGYLGIRGVSGMDRGVALYFGRRF